MGNAQEENIQLKHSIQLKDDLIKGYGTETDPYSGESTPSVSGKVFRGGYTVQVGTRLISMYSCKVFIFFSGAR